MQWFVEIFASTSDLARLITTIIAAIIAITVVLLNQWYNSRRARKEKLIGKIEEIYAAIIKMRLIKASIQNVIVTRHPGSLPSKYSAGENKSKWLKELAEYHNEFSGLAAQVDMLSGLYIPKLQGQVKNIWNAYIALYMHFIETENLVDYLDGADVLIEKLDRHFEGVIESLSGVMKDVMH